MEPATPFLLCRGADGEQVCVDLDRERMTIGRRESNDLALPWDGQVSRVHAAIERMGGDWVVTDAVSHNGTFVNGERVRGRRRLRDGDAISVGGTLISFCAADSQSLGITSPAVDRPPAIELTAAQCR